MVGNQLARLAFVSGAHRLGFITLCQDFWIAVTAKEKRVQYDLEKCSSAWIRSVRCFFFILHWGGRWLTPVRQAQRVRQHCAHPALSESLLSFLSVVWLHWVVQWCQWSSHYHQVAFSGLSGLLSPNSHCPARLCVSPCCNAEDLLTWEKIQTSLQVLK